jgi:oligogalacturonide lyase
MLCENCRCKRLAITLLSVCILFSIIAHAQIGRRFPSERKVIRDPVTGTMLTFLTSTPNGDSKIYQTHNQWTSDGQWLVFRSNRVRGEAIAVHEQTGEMVQVTEGGYTGMLNIARLSMKLYFMRIPRGDTNRRAPVDTTRRRNALLEIVEVDLGKLFNDSKAGKVKPASAYQRVCGVTPPELGAGGDMALDGDENRVYFRVGREEAAKHLPPGTKLESSFGPRNMGAGPSGIAAMNIHTGEIKHVVSVPFQVGHIQTNPWVPGEIVFCWETGGKSPQRTWTVRADGTGLGAIGDKRKTDRSRDCQSSNKRDADRWSNPQWQRALACECFTRWKMGGG